MIIVRGIFLVLILSTLSLNSCKKNDPEIMDCDTMAASYKNDIVPILNSSCNTMGCHESGTANGDYTNYEGIKEAADNGTLRNRVITNKTMPLSSSLITEQLNKMECWLDSNAPNN